MKQLHFKYIIILSILFLAINSHAQVELGLKIGLNNTLPSGTDFIDANNTSSDFGYDAGLVAHFPLGKSGLFLSTGLGLNKLNFSSDTKDPLLAENIGWFFDTNGNDYFDFGEPEALWDDLNYHREYELSAFSIPVGLMYKLIGKKVNLYFEGGLDFNYINKGSLVVDLKDSNGTSESPSALFYTEQVYTFSYLDFYQNSTPDLFQLVSHQKENLYYANELSFGSADENYFKNVLLSANLGLGVYIDLFHGDIYLGANYQHALNSISNNNDIDVNTPDALNRVAVSVKYTIDLVL